MLYAPLLTGLVTYGVPAQPATLLLALASGLFFAQNAWGLALRGRLAGVALLWPLLYSAVALGSGGTLVLILDLWSLLPLALPAAIVLAVQAGRRGATRRQIDHSTGNELLSAAVMASGAAAAYLAAPNPWGPGVAVPWVIFALYFGGTVLYVKMRVSALRAAQIPARLAVFCLAWHTMLLALAVALLAVPGSVAALPALLRAIVGWRRPVRISLRRLGFTEMFYALWFSGWIGFALSRV